MTLIEAIKSGKPFRRPHKLGSPTRLEFNGHDGVTTWIERFMLDDFRWLRLEDLLANDWEVKEAEKKEITLFRMGSADSWKEVTRENLIAANYDLRIPEFIRVKIIDLNSKIE